MYNATAAAIGVVDLDTHRFFLALALAIYVISVPFSTYNCVYGLRMPHLSPIIRLYIANVTLNVYAHLFSVSALLSFALTAGWRLKVLYVKELIFEFSFFKVHNAQLLSSSVQHFVICLSKCLLPPRSALCLSTGCSFCFCLLLVTRKSDKTIYFYSQFSAASFAA